MESKVKEILGVAKRKDGSEIRGEKNGKNWVMMRVKLENDIELNMFAPIEVGDEVIELVQDPTYKSWKGKVKKNTKQIANMSDGSTGLLKEILEELKAIRLHLAGEDSKPMSKFEAFSQKNAQKKQELSQDQPKDILLDDTSEQERQELLESIPF